MGYSFALYASITPRLLQPGEVNAIISKSTQNNKRFHITGFLHYERCWFLQYVEGPKGAVEGCLARIARDRRHMNFRIIADGELDKRLYDGWSMGTLDGVRVADIQRIVEADLEDPELDEWIMDLLRMFAMHSGSADDASISVA